MKTLLMAAVSLVALSGCGLEQVFTNGGRGHYDRPASRISGQVAWTGAPSATVVGLDGDGNELAPFQTTLSASGYEMRLPSSSYSMVRVQGRAGNMALRAIVPAVGEEDAVDGVDLDARNMTETLIVEARLSADKQSFRQLTPAAYVGDGVTTGTRTLIRKAFETPGPTQQLLGMVERIIAKANVTSGAATPDFFAVPVVDSGDPAAPVYTVTTSPVSAGWLVRNQIDLDGDGIVDSTPAAFDALLAAAAQLFKPGGCPDPVNVRLMFTVDFNEGALNGNCTAVNRFKWATDKPGKSMFFVGWVHEDSPIQDPVVNARLGASVPNQIQMFDDGTNGDEVAGDNIWTVTFEVPRGLRIGYKYTWGMRGSVWTGTEEWPGNSRLLEVVDVNGDGFVYRRDVFGDEATNKDNMNLSSYGGAVTWTTDFRGCGLEVHEQKVTLHSACGCGEWITPKSIGPVTVACTE